MRHLQLDFRLLEYRSFGYNRIHRILVNGKKYSHTIDPKTGLPVTGIKSVTIISPNAELADAMATPVMIMGTKAGLNMINQIKGMACIIIDDNDKLFTSKNIQIK